MRQKGEGLAISASREARLLEAVEKSGASPATLSQLATYYEKAKRYDDWATVLKQMLGRGLPQEEMVKTKHNLAIAFYLQRKLDEAIDCAERLIRQYPVYPELSQVHQLLGSAYGERSVWYEDSNLEQRDLKKAEEHLTIALELCRNRERRGWILEELGTALYNNGRLEEARATLEQALESDIEDPVLLSVCYERLGGVFYNLGETDRAISSYEKSCSINPDHPNNSTAVACIEVADLHLRKGNVERARRCAQQAERVIDRTSPRWASWVTGRLYELLGDIALEEGAHQQAIESFQRALQEQNRPGEEDDLYQKLGIAFEKKGQYQDAVEFYRRALAFYTSDDSQDWQDHIVGLMAGMAHCAYYMEDFQQAIALLEPIVEKLEPSSLGLGYLRLGHSNFSLGRINRAREAYWKALKKTRFFSEDWREAAKYFLWAVLRST